jgi:UDP-N-acetylglucosamine 2-epimerase (non-hydrolysing)
MNEVFFKQFELRNPAYHLEVGSGNHGVQTGKIMKRFEELCMKDRPGLVFTVGDVNSTMACALVASKLHIPLAHQEAGMRSFDRTMPEEVNRVVTDVLSDLLFPISPTDKENLIREGISSKKIFTVGDVMIDNLLYYTNEITEEFGSKKHILVEVHRPANVDNKNNLTEIAIAISKLSERFRVIFPVHPRTSKMIDKFDLWKYMSNVDYCKPMGYFDFIKHMKNSVCMITDSDGSQQETSILDVPCVAIRNNSNTEYTVKYGTTVLCAPNSSEIFSKATYNEYKKSNFPEWLKKLNDGNAANRIAEILVSRGGVN